MAAAGQVVHMVWFRFKADATPAQVDAAMAELRALQGVIPEIVSLSCGPNFTTRTPHTHGLLVVLKDKEALPTYSDHPAHQRVVKEFILPIKEDIVALDYVV